MTSRTISGRRLSVSVDIGGTFTDVCLLDRTTGRLTTTKVPTTVADPSIGFMNGIGQALEQADASHAALQQVFHATTVATNLILEAKGAVTGLITSEGFRHVLEIGRHDVPRGANLFAWQKTPRPVPPQRILEVEGRIGVQGQQLQALDENAVRTAAHALRRQGTAAVAVCFLHSYANPVHERRAREILLEEWPQAVVTLSCEVLPTFREFERTMVTILNAYVMPAVSTYVERLEHRLRDQNVAAPLMLMKSNGGVASAALVRREPVQTALSGPAAGVVGMQLFARLAGVPDVIGVDIGGTSADISLIKGGEPGMTMQGRIGEWPLTLPMVDIHTIGAGGGSIARISPTGALLVGPDSAGAQPGPVCYSRGSTQPTVTDAHAVLGHLPTTLLNGAMKLDVGAARRAIVEQIADPLGMSAEQAARGILAIADNRMVGAIRVVSVERGHDPREFALVPFGGAGPLHGGSLARLLGMRTQLLPPSPGVLSALGLQVSRRRADFQRTHLSRAGTVDFEAMEAAFAELEGEAGRWFDDEGVEAAAQVLRRVASMRYQGQGFELQVPWVGGRADAAALAATVQGFHAMHEAMYTFAQEDTPVECVTLHLEATTNDPETGMRKLELGGPVEQARIGAQDVHFEQGTVHVPIYDRSRLGHGAQVAGPAIFVQLDTTVLMLSGQDASVDSYGNMLIRERDA